jgi:hypothetical protein
MIWSPHQTWLGRFEKIEMGSECDRHGKKRGALWENLKRQLGRYRGVWKDKVTRDLQDAG